MKMQRFSNLFVLLLNLTLFRNYKRNCAQVLHQLQQMPELNQSSLAQSSGC